MKNSYLKHGREYFFYAEQLTNVVKVEGHKEPEQPATQTIEGEGNLVLWHAIFLWLFFLKVHI